MIRGAEGKCYSYVVVPVPVATGEDPEAVLDNNDRYQIVWQVFRVHSHGIATPAQSGSRTGKPPAKAGGHGKERPPQRHGAEREQARNGIPRFRVCTESVQRRPERAAEARPGL